MRKTWFAVAVVIVLLSGIAGWGDAASAQESRLGQKVYGPPEELLPPLNYTVSVFNGTVGREEGRPVLYTTSKGKPGRLNVIDLRITSCFAAYRSRLRRVRGPIRWRRTGPCTSRPRGAERGCGNTLR